MKRALLLLLIIVIFSLFTGCDGSVLNTVTIYNPSEGTAYVSSAYFYANTTVSVPPQSSVTVYVNSSSVHLPVVVSGRFYSNDYLVYNISDSVMALIPTVSWIKLKNNSSTAFSSATFNGTYFIYDENGNYTASTAIEAGSSKYLRVTSFTNSTTYNVVYRVSGSSSDEQSSLKYAYPAAGKEHAITLPDS